MRHVKILSFVLALIMAVSMVAGCSKEESKTTEQAKTADQPQTAAKATAAATTAENKVYTIDWLPQCDGPVDENSPVIVELMKLFPNVKINFIYLDRSKEAELLNVRLASGEIPDVMRLNSDDRYRQYIQQGVLVELPEDTLQKSAPKLYEMVKTNSGGKAWEWAKENGKLYGIPSLNPDGRYNFVPVWRNDWLTNVGITKIPETLTEAEDAFYKFVNNDPDKNNKKDTYALSDKGFSTIFGAYGGIPYFSKGGGSSFTWSLKDGKVVATAVMPEMKEALTLLNKWYKDGLIDPEFISEENKGQSWSYSLPFWNGKIGFTTPGQYYHVCPPLFDGDPGSGWYQNFKKIQTNGTYTEGKPLAGPTGKSCTESWGEYTGTYIVMGINVTKDPGKMEKILDIFEKVAGDFDTFVLAKFGIKGVTYDIVNGSYTAIGDAAKSLEENAKLGLNVNGLGFTATDNFEYYYKMLPAKYAYADKVGKNNRYTNVVWGGLPSAAQYKATIEKKIKEAIALFVSGERNISEFDKFVEELNKAGLEQLTKEANDWYVKFNK